MTILSPVESVVNALKIESAGGVVAMGGGLFAVISATDTETRYTVNPTAGSCTCPAFKYRGGKCKHQIAVSISRERERRNK